MKKSFLVYLKNTTASSFLMRTTQNQACYRLKNQFRKQKSDLNRTRTTFQSGMIWPRAKIQHQQEPGNLRKLWVSSLAALSLPTIPFKSVGLKTTNVLTTMLLWNWISSNFTIFLSLQTEMLPNPTKNRHGIHKLKRSSFTTHCYWVRGTSTVVIEYTWYKVYTLEV